MTEMYFDIEIAYSKQELIDKLKAGIKVPVRPGDCKIITIQYQLLGKNGLPLTDLKIFKEWESSEEEIIKKFWNMLRPETQWDYIPVGHNIYFDLGMVKERAKIYNMKMDDWALYHDKPAIDLKHICIAMNNFEFKGSGLDRFSGKETSGINVPVWYSNMEYGKIIEYIQKETKEFVDFYAKLKRTLPEFRKQQGFFNPLDATRPVRS